MRTDIGPRRSKMSLAPARSRPRVVAALAICLLATTAGGAERSGNEIAKSQCAKCHEQGVLGAPRIGDKVAWAPRLNKGVDTLVHVAIRGHGGMPPRGGQADLTDTELRAALLYMFNPAGPPADLPKAAERAAPRVAAMHRVTAGGMDVYFGRVSAERMRAFPAGSPEAKIHGGIPKGKGYHHVNVSLFDAASQKQVTGATVEFEMEQLGRGREKKALEAVTLSGSNSYGAYVRLAPRSDYTFLVRVTKPGSATPVEAKFKEHLN